MTVQEEKKPVQCPYSGSITCPGKLTNRNIECFLCLYKLLLRDFEVFYTTSKNSLFPLTEAGKIVGTLRGHVELLNAVSKLIKETEPEYAEKIEKIIESQKQQINEVVEPKKDLRYVS